MECGILDGTINHKQNPRLNRVGRPEGGAHILHDGNRTQQVEKRLGNTQRRKSHVFFVYYSPLNFLFLSITEFFLYCAGLAHGSPCLQTPNYNSLLISNKPIFSGEIVGSLFVLDQRDPGTGKE